MKIFAPATAAWFRTIKRPPHCLVLVILPLLASGPVAVAQPDRAAISLPAKESDSDAQSPESPTYVKRFDRTYFRDRSASHYYLFNPLPPSNLTPAFYPPVPPALGAELTLLPPLTAGFPAPAELAEFISDWFYPLLASQLTGNGLSESLRAQLQSYRAKKTGLQNELRSHLARLKDWAPDRREKDLAAFAAEQSPRLAELENIAEEIRHDLRHNDLLGAPVGNDDWTTSAGPLPPNASAEDEKKIETALLRGAVFYQDGLSAAQRRLLLEEIISRENTIRPSSSGVSTRPQEWQLPFSPSPARIRLAVSLPPTLAQKISDYSGAKQSLKTELSGALLANVGTDHQTRTALMKQLGAAQAARIAALEISAEEIRRELATLPDSPGPPVAPALPPALESQIATYRAHKLATLKTLYSLLADKAKPLNSQNNPGSWMRDGSVQTEVRTKKSSLSTADFDNVQRPLLIALNQEEAGIRAALAEHFRHTDQPADGKTINDLLRDFENARQKQEAREKYRDYQTAVLMPGLSAAQRQLLFDAAVENLSLPLPPGEKIR